MNTYNTNGNGLSVEIDAFYDTYLSHCYFQDNFKRLTRNNDSLWFYTEYQNIEKVELEDMYTVTDNTRENVIKLLKEWVIDRELDFNVLCNNELAEILKNDVDLDFDDEKFFELDYENFAILETGGYSQGDYAEVYVDLRAMRKLTGKEDFDADTLKNTIHNLFWDCPLCVKVTIDGKEFEELLEDEYACFDDIKEDIENKLKKEITKEQFDTFKELFDTVEPRYL